VAPLVRTGGSRHTGLAALPHRNIQRSFFVAIQYHVIPIMSIIDLKYFLRSFVSDNKKVSKMIFHSPSRPNFYRYSPYSTI